MSLTFFLKQECISRLAPNSSDVKRYASDKFNIFQDSLGKLAAPTVRNTRVDRSKIYSYDPIIAEIRYYKKTQVRKHGRAN